MPKKIVFSNNPLFSGPSIEDRNVAAIPYKEISLSAIDRDPNQPRVNFDEQKLEELSNSIKTYGVLSPIIVRPSNLPNKYILVAGERRFRASKMAGFSVIPAIVDSKSDQTGERTLAIQLVENIQRAELTPLEKAYAISALKETNKLSVRDVAQRIGISKSAVQRSLELLDLPDDLINALVQGASESKILVLSKVKNSKKRAELLKDLDKISRDDLEGKLNRKKSKQAKATATPEDLRIADEIQRTIGMKVALKRKVGDSEAGKISVDFHSEADLQLIFRKLVS